MSAYTTPRPGALNIKEARENAEIVLELAEEAKSVATRLMVRATKLRLLAERMERNDRKAREA